MGKAGVGMERKKIRIIIIVSVCFVLLVGMLAFNYFSASYREGSLTNGYVRIDSVSVATVTYHTGTTRQFLRVELVGENTTDRDLWYYNFFLSTAMQGRTYLKRGGSWGLEYTAGGGIYTANSDFQETVYFYLDYGPGNIKIEIVDEMFQLRSIFLNVYFDGEDVTILER